MKSTSLSFLFLFSCCAFSFAAPSPFPSSSKDTLPASLFSGTHSYSNVTVNQDFKGMALQTNPGVTATLANVNVTNGNIFWGHGGTSVTLKNIWGGGSPWKYRVCNFDNPLKLLTWDNSGTAQWIIQGPNEAAVRLMQIDEAHISNIKIQGSKDSKGWIKQVVQDRSGGKHYWTNITIHGLVDIGYMTDPAIPVQPLALSYWENSTMDGYSVRPGLKHLVMKNCTVAGKIVNIDRTYP